MPFELPPVGKVDAALLPARCRPSHPTNGVAAGLRQWPFRPGPVGGLADDARWPRGSDRWLIARGSGDASIGLAANIAEFEDQVFTGVFLNTPSFLGDGSVYVIVPDGQVIESPRSQGDLPFTERKAYVVPAANPSAR